VIVGSVSIGLGFAVAVLSALGIALALKYSSAGFRASLVGASEKTAHYAGYSVRRMQILTFVLSGAIGGLAGAILEIGTVRGLSSNLSNYTGYYGIVVAMLAGRSLAGTIPTGLLVGVLLAAETGLQLAGASPNAGLAMTGFLLLLAGIADALARYRVRVRLPEAASQPRGGLVAERGPP
jgi:simple sugar transport system permease protein